MMAARQTARFQCGHEGCKEFAIYDYYSADERKRLYRTYDQGRWRCTRHMRMEEVLGSDNHRTVCEYTAKKVPATFGEYLDGLFWTKGDAASGSGFTSGPGFKAFASDFPAGTVIRVTAEIILPQAEDGRYLVKVPK